MPESTTVPTASSRAASSPSAGGDQAPGPVESPLLQMTPTALKEVRAFTLTDLCEPEGRVEIWEEFKPGMLVVAGADTAFGIPGRDFDAGMFLCKHPGPLRQVAEVHGHYGDRFDRILYAMCRYFGDAFLLVERATLGLAILQRLYDEYDYRWLYYEKREESKTRKHTDNLGIPPTGKDLILWGFRRAVLDRSILLRSRPLIEQMGRLQFRESTPSPTGERRVDEDLKVSLAGGGSPDLVMAAAYALHASTQVQHYEKPVDPRVPGSLGDILGFYDTFEKKQAGNSWKRRKR